MKIDLKKNRIKLEGETKWRTLRRLEMIGIVLIILIAAFHFITIEEPEAAKPVSAQVPNSIAVQEVQPPKPFHELKLVPDTDAEYMSYHILRKMGYSHASAAGIMGNMYQESKMDSKATNSHACGLFQLEGPRLEDYKRYVNDHEYGMASGAAQLAFMNREMNSEDLKGRMRGEIAPSNLTDHGASPISGIEEFKQIDDAEQAARIFCAVYERPGTPELQKRIEIAKHYDNMFNGIQ